MKKVAFSLMPFTPSASLVNMKIAGHICRRADSLAIHFELTGSLEELLIPSPASVPLRANALWDETCFEFFFGTVGADRYWEFNLSPSGHWNVYRFHSYRYGMQEERAYTSLPFSVQKHANVFHLALEFHLNRIIPALQAINVGVSSVIQSRDGNLTFWALKHPGPQADFHRRGSFIVTL